MSYPQLTVSPGGGSQAPPFMSRTDLPWQQWIAGVLHRREADYPMLVLKQRKELRITGDWNLTRSFNPPALTARQPPQTALTRQCRAASRVGSNFAKIQFYKG